MTTLDDEARIYFQELFKTRTPLRYRARPSAVEIIESSGRTQTTESQYRPYPNTHIAGNSRMTGKVGHPSPKTRHPLNVGSLPAFTRTPKATERMWDEENEREKKAHESKGAEPPRGSGGAIKRVTRQDSGWRQATGKYYEALSNSHADEWKKHGMDMRRATLNSPSGLRQLNQSVTLLFNRRLRIAGHVLQYAAVDIYHSPAPALLKLGGLKVIQRQRRRISETNTTCKIRNRTSGEIVVDVVSGWALFESVVPELSLRGPQGILEGIVSLQLEFPADYTHLLVKYTNGDTLKKILF
ncbi:hypothetical protein DFH09DRAFT_1107707 [Mycena vulgaris]|nr:hypothetical protein DFH09DRAFT_1107707 [Mycena vulgaris]